MQLERRCVEHSEELDRKVESGSKSRYNWVLLWTCITFSKYRYKYYFKMKIYSTTNENSYISSPMLNVNSNVWKSAKIKKRIIRVHITLCFLFVLGAREMSKWLRAIVFEDDLNPNSGT